LKNEASSCYCRRRLSGNQQTQAVSPATPTRQQLAKLQGRERRLARYQQVIDLYQQGHSVNAISRTIQLEQETSRIRAGQFPEHKRPIRPRPKVHAFAEHLQRRWVEGCRNATKLFLEIRELGYLAREIHISKPTREKEIIYLDEYILPTWGTFRLNQIQPQAVEDWLHTTFESWWTMHGVRAIMIRIYRHAEGHGLWEEDKRNPISKTKIGKKRYKNERRILSFEKTARVLEHLVEPNRLIIETCIATGARISEVLGLKWKHVDVEAATIKIEQRVWHQEISRPKSEGSKRTLGIWNGYCSNGFPWRAAADATFVVVGNAIP
jgi:integrase